jgi:hypothetical protein
MAQIEAIVKPDGVGNDIGRESVAFVCVHSPILSNWVFNLAVPYRGLRKSLVAANKLSVLLSI